ncbi:hypothetical protein C5895_000730 [Escherichia coli O40:H32]|nr:hypothetical protein [Escherichia coli O40:H32]
MSQEEWEALPALISGFTAGKASSAQVNKVIRQASFIAAALAQFVSDKTQRDVLDNGDLPGFVELLGSGFAVEYLSRKNPFGDIKSDGTVKTALENLSLGDISAAGVATGSMGETGYAIFPMMIGGTRKTFIMQWGTLTLLRSGGTVDINLPIAFPTMVMQAYATHDNVIQTARPTVYAIAPTSRTTITATAMSLRADSVGAAVTRGSDSDLCYGRYLAIGY